ncbi:MAG: hypothetical protein IK990_17515 [Ruminiclostridium sp.]|nr:hypothetical protein [Ruminiclostridium sp.]
MKTLYLLIITDIGLSDPEDFLIGVFTSENQAADIAEYYIREVPGFCEYPCEYRVTPKYADSDSGTVWLVQGWDENERFDEINAVESELFASETQAQKALSEMQERYARQEWSVNCYKVCERLWSEGFCRVKK